MTTKRVYADLIPLPFTNSINDDFFLKERKCLIKGFCPSIYQKFPIYKLNMQNLYSISNDEFESTINTAIEQVYITSELPNDYNDKINLFKASSKALDTHFIKTVIKESLVNVSQQIFTIFVKCESIQQISINWCRMCRMCNKIEYLVYCLPHDKNIIDILCDQLKNEMDYDQKKIIEKVVIDDFSSFENKLLNDMKETFDFLCKLDIYSEEFVSKIETIVLNHFKTTINTMDQIASSEKIDLLLDKIKSLIYFSSVILKANDIKKLTCDLNDEFSIFIFECLENYLPNFIEFHQIQDISTFLKASNIVGKSSRFVEIINSSFCSYVESFLNLSSEVDLFHNLNKITSYLLDLCKSLGKYIRNKLVPSFRKIINKNSNHFAVVIAFGVDNAIRNQLDFDISTTFFLFKLMESKDIFEAYHANLLMMRIKNNKGNILLPDLMLIDEIRSYCGEFYAKRFDLLISGADFSKKCYDLFCGEFEVPDIFSVFLIDSNLMTIFSSNLNDKDETNKLPETIKIISAQYFGYLRDNFPNRKFRWCLQMTEVELKCIIDKNSNFNSDSNYNSDINSHNQIIVKCNAYCASFILSFNGNNGQTLNEILNNSKLDENDISRIYPILSSEKVNLVRIIDRKYYINYAPKKSIIKIPSFTTIDTLSKENDRRTYILDNQIDCLIIKILKTQRNIDKKNLFQNVINEIGDQITEERYMKRVENLKRKYFLSENEYGTISYVP